MRSETREEFRARIESYHAAAAEMLAEVSPRRLKQAERYHRSVQVRDYRPWSLLIDTDKLRCVFAVAEIIDGKGYGIDSSSAILRRADEMRGRP